MSRPATLPRLYGQHGRWGLIEGDCLALLPAMPAGYFDSLVTDPPYGLGFQGQTWDGGALADGEGLQAFTRWWAAEALRLLKPGAWAAVHGAPRTVHRLAAGLEDAGFEIRDQLMWCFAGVPKSRRMAGGLGSGLRPAWEPIVLARKPLDRRCQTIAGNVARHGTGALQIDAGRIERGAGDPGAEGYWPANLALSHEPDCAPGRGECVPDCPLPLIDRVAAGVRAGRSPPLSRLFYAAKASRAEREAGLTQLPRSSSPIFSGGSSRPRACTHPTVKPLALMRWLIRLVTPPAGLVLDPFAGSGSTLIAALQEGRPALGLEREPAYATIARARVVYWARQPRDQQTEEG